ncbi:peptide ABC transporter substrate-binding protein [Aureimonas ureilytica]|uniref:Peptide ABC transporter substrate-binding protein n=1 Tax=Aureimonas ureilytica TaxID=401562 RepID=A0A175RWQ3_9HYPH|nr:ABC transporter substrate-binding protein [Aureimonas ureilytica]KTR07312.1 peptide ABC transporter substrate-binding protein [Aureimonas ureilytica]
MPSLRLRALSAALAGTALACALAASPASAQEKGGSLRLLARAAAGTIDPQINYTLQYWQLFYITYDGLVTFRKAGDKTGFEVVPDLAEALPTPENDGKSYTFKLRKGIKFSNGQDLTTDDVVASFQRIFKISGPTAGTFYNGIVGADKCIASPADCTLEGGVVADKAAGTVTINLTAPDGEFLQKIAVPHAYIMPASTPASDQGTTPIPGTGPYAIQSYDPNAAIKFVRNPNFKEWSAEAQPDGLADDISYDFGLTEEAAVTAIQNGDADWMFDQPPPDRLSEIGTQYANQVSLHPLTAMWYAPMNTNLAPFDNIKARQAVNFAIDRNAIVKLFGGANLAQPACQILPPDFPGHVPYCPYTLNPGTTWSAPDMEKAKALVAESGTAGQEVKIIAEDTVVSRAIGVYLQDILSELGYKASVQPISQNLQFTYIQNTNNKVQISISQWFQDYPSPSNFLNVLFSCASFHPGSDASVNIAGFCDKAVDAKMAEAFAAGVKDPKAALPIWSEVDKMVTDAAPAAVLFTPKRVDFVSSRVQNFTFSPQFYAIFSKIAVQ